MMTRTAVGLLAVVVAMQHTKEVQACFNMDTYSVKNGEYEYCCFHEPTDRMSYFISATSNDAYKVRVEFKKDLPGCKLGEGGTSTCESFELINDAYDGIPIKEGYCSVAPRGVGHATCEGYTTSDGDNFYHQFSGCFEDVFEGERYDHCQYTMNQKENDSHSGNQYGGCVDGSTCFAEEPLCVVVECEAQDGQCEITAALWRGGFGDSPFSSTPGSPTTMAPQPTRRWTLLHYMHADTDLEVFQIRDVAEMLQGPAGGNLILLIDRSKGCQGRTADKKCDEARYTESMEDFVDTAGNAFPYTTEAIVARRMLTSQGQQKWEVIEQLGEKNLDDPDVLTTFISKYLTMFPSQYRALVMSDHGGSYLGFGGDEDKGSSDEQHFPQQLWEIKYGIERGLRDAGIDKLDLLGFDACLMSGVIVQNALFPHTRYFLASEELEPGHGWNYRSLDLNAADPVALGKPLVDSFVAHGRNAQALALSLVDTSKYPIYLKAFSDFVTILEQVAKAKSKNAIKLILRAQSNTWKFDGAGETNVHLDFGDFLDKLIKMGNTTCLRLSESAQKLRAAYNTIQVYERDDGKHPEVFTGIHISIPPLNKNSADYTILWKVADNLKEFYDEYSKAGIDSRRPSVTVAFVNAIMMLKNAAISGVYTEDDSMCQSSTGTSSCHESCDGCGYSAFPSGRLNCIACADKSAVNAVFDDGTGICGDDELVSSELQPEMRDLPFDVVSLDASFSDEFKDYPYLQLISAVSDIAVAIDFHLAYTYREDPSTTVYSSSQRGHLLDSEEDSQVVGAYSIWWGDTFGLYQQVNGTDDPRLSFATPPYQHNGVSYFYSDIYAFETDIDADRDGEPEAAQLEIPIVIFRAGSTPTTKADSMGVQRFVCDESCIDRATLKIIYDYVTQRETLSIYYMDGLSPTEWSPSQGGMFVPLLGLDRGDGLKIVLSTAIFLWGDVAPRYDGSIQKDALNADYYNVFSSDATSDAPLFKDIIIEGYATAINGGSAAKQLVYSLEALQNYTLTSRAPPVVSGTISFEKPALTASATIVGVSKEALESETGQKLFKDSIANVAKVTPDQVIIRKVQHSLAGRLMLRHHRRKLQNGSSVTIDFAVLFYKTDSIGANDVKAALTTPNRLSNEMKALGLSHVLGVSITKVSTEANAAKILEQASTRKYCDVSGSTRDDVDGRYYKYGSQTCDSKPVYYNENDGMYLYLNTNSNWMISGKGGMETCGTSGYAYAFSGTADYPHWTGLKWQVTHSSTWLEVPNLRISCPGEPTRPASYTYSYTTGSWSSCSASCGGGTSTRSVTCKRSDGQSVSDSSCSGSKPSTSQSCNTGACATTTTTTTITFNEDGCDNKSLHTNNVNCGADEEETLVSSSGCGAFWASACYDCCKKQEAGEATPTPAPTTTTEAQTTSAITTNPAKAPTTSPTTTSYTYAFSEGSFGSCSETCGGGTRTRSVTCLRSDGQAVAETMCSGTKPSTSGSCNNQPCNNTSKNDAVTTAAPTVVLNSSSTSKLAHVLQVIATILLFFTVAIN